MNNWRHSLFGQVYVYLNDTLVAPSLNTYPFRAYVDTVLSYGSNAKNTQLTSQLWYKDTTGHMNAINADGDNTGLVERRRHISESRAVEMMGQLHLDLFLQDRFLLNGVSVKIRLVRSNDAFSLMAGCQNPDYNVQIVDAVMFARCAESDCSNGSHKRIGKGRTKYQIRPVDGKVYSIPQGAILHTHENLFLETLSKRLMLWCIDNDAYNREYSKTHLTPRTTPLTTWPSRSTDVRFRRNRYSQTLRPAATFEATSTYFPPPVKKHRTNGTSCRAMTLAKATPYSASI